MEHETRQEAQTFSIVIVDAMRSKGMTIEKLSQITGVSDRFLSHIVNEEFEKLPAAPYLHGYVTKIADALGLKGETLWQEYLKDSAVVRRSGKHDLLPQNRFVTPELNKRVIVIAAVAVLVVGYLAFRLPTLLGSPTISVDLPDMATVSEPTFRISGTMNPADGLTINREPVYPDSNGVFERTVTLDPGFNTFEFRAERFLGKNLVIVKQVFYRVPTSTETTQPANAHQESF